MVSFDSKTNAFDKAKISLIFLKIREKLQRRYKYFRTTIDPLYRKLKYFLTEQGSAPKSLKIIHVNPEKIELLTYPCFHWSIGRFGTHIIGGNWDIVDEEYNLSEAERMGSNRGLQYIKLVKIEKYGLYRASKKRYLQGKNWNDTEIMNFSELKKEPKSYRKNIKKSIEIMDNIVNNIKNEGYLNQTELDNKYGRIGKDPYFPPEHSEILVNIGRDGEIIFEDGRHRLIAAKILNIKKIPARVLVRHKKWQQLRKTLYNAKYMKNLTIQQQLYLRHPDMNDLMEYLQKNTD